MTSGAVDRLTRRRNTVRMGLTRWARYVALGDSITEGLCDPVAGGGDRWLGWADRLATILDGNAQLSGKSIEFANLAVRGRRVRDVVEQQIPTALELKPELVSVLIGGNDLMSARADPDALAAELETGIAALRAAGIDVLLANCFDPQVAFFVRPFRGRAAVFNANVWSIARTHRTYTLDLWGIRELQNVAMWSEDRVHLSSAGHRLLASRAAHTLGVPYFELPGAEARLAPQLAGSLSTAAWLRTHAIPWVGRRLLRVSAGDGISPKLPTPITVAQSS